MRGYLQITFGPMFSGKTSHLIHTIHKYLDVNEAKGDPKRGMIVNSSLDERVTKQDCQHLTTHSSNKKKVRDDILCIKTIRLEMISDQMIKDVDIISVDEAQFFSDLNRVEKWVEQGKYVHLSGLIADAQRRPFGDLVKLMHLADDVEQLKAHCIYCTGMQMNAPFTRTKEETVLDRIYPGGYETYVPVCGKHL